MLENREIAPVPPSAETPLDIAKTWTGNQVPLLTELLEEITLDVIRKQEHILEDGSGVVKGIFNADPFTRPICHGIIRRLPQEVLKPDMEKKMGHLICFATERRNGSYRHSDIKLGDIHIDPTFGQFFSESFFTIREQHPNLFIKHVLVASEYDLRKTFGVTYEYDS